MLTGLSRFEGGFEDQNEQADMPNTWSSNTKAFGNVPRGTGLAILLLLPANETYIARRPFLSSFSLLSSYVGLLQDHISPSQQNVCITRQLSASNP